MTATATIDTMKEENLLANAERVGNRKADGGDEDAGARDDEKCSGHNISLSVQATPSADGLMTR